MGFIFVPLMTIAFASLDPGLRTEGAGIFNLVRNIGSSIGISAVITLLTRSIQVNHASLAEHVSPFNPALQNLRLPGGLDPTSQIGLAAIDGMINRQAAMIAYLNDFKFMMVVALFAFPLVLVLRNPYRKRGRPPPGQGGAALAE
jgi:DHA2 family multidrug resistance protein